MLLPTQAISEQIEQVLTALNSGAIDHTTAGERILGLDPHDSDGYTLLATAAEKENPPDLDRAEDLFWEALRRRPCEHHVYLNLADLRSIRHTEDALVKGLSVLGIWKLAVAYEIPADIAEHFGEKVSQTDLDWSDPHSYETIASAWEEEIEEKGEPAEITARLLPYRLLNRVQLEAGMMTPELVREVLANAAVCAPVFQGALWNWGRHDEAIDADSLRLVAAFLGEIGGTEVLSDLLPLATHEDSGLVLHAHWGIYRIGQRFPGEALSFFRSVTAGSVVSVRCALAEQIGMLPDIPGREDALLDLIQDFGSIAGEDDSPYLLLATSYALEQIGRRLQARETLLRFERMLTTDGRQWLREMRDEGFAPLLAEQGLPGLTLEDVAVRRELMHDSEEDAGDWDDEEDELVSPVITVPKPGPERPVLVR